MGAWGARWLELGSRDVDAAYVLWATSRLVQLDQLPDTGHIVRIDLVDRPRERFRMVLRQPQAEVCSSDPGHSEDLVLTSDSETLARWHLRHVSYDDAVRAGRVRIEGPRRQASTFLRSIKASPFAEVIRAY